MGACMLKINLFIPYMHETEQSRNQKFIEHWYIVQQ